jgi:F-type H+-transporting ATPase subunit epsilon
MSLELEVLAPDGVVLQARAKAVRAADASGEFGLWPGHEAFLTALVPGVLSVRREDGGESFVAVDGGLLLVEGRGVTVVTCDAVAAARLEDVAEAARAMLEERRRQERAARAEFAELEALLLRELGQAERRK